MTADSVVHEAEVQRQYVRVRVPALVMLEGVEVECFDWSVNGLGVHVSSEYTPGAKVSGTIGFDFDGFVMSLDFDAEVRHVSDIELDGRGVRRVGLEFVDLTTRSQSLLRYVSSAYITGDAVAAGDVLHLAQRDNTAAPRKKGAKKHEENLTKTQRILQTMRTPISWVVLLVVLLFSVSLTSNAFYKNAYVRQLATAEVMTDTPTARAPATGVITFIAGVKGDIIETGKPLLGVRRPTGEEVFVDSPCDCQIVSVERTLREFIESGEVVLRMLHPDSRTFVRLYVSKSNAPWLFEFRPDYLYARILGQDQKFMLTIEDSLFDSPREMIILDLFSDVEMPSDLAGSPATVIMDAGRRTLVGRVRSWFEG